MAQHIVFFLRGLNTRGGDHLRFGPIDLGPMHGSILRSYKTASDFPILNVPNIGFGSFDEMTQRAYKNIELQIRNIISSGSAKLRSSVNSSTLAPINVHLIGHSMGGLLARRLVHQKPNLWKWSSVVTVGTSHLGTPVAKWFIDNLETKRPIDIFIRAAGFDPCRMKTIYSQFSPESLDQFNQMTPNHPDVSYACALATRPKTLWPAIFDLVPSNKGVPTDGIVPLESQKWGQILGHYELNHWEQVGNSNSLLRKSRLHTQSEFQRMIANIGEFHQSRVW